MRVAIDTRKLRDFGIGTYVRNLVQQLSSIDTNTEYVLLCRPTDRQWPVPLGNNFQTITQRSPNYSLREQLLLPLTLKRLGVNLFHAPHYVLPALTPCRSIVTIHDCIHLRFPQYLPSTLAHTYARMQIWTAIRRSNRILTVSESSKQDILHFFDVEEDKIVVIHNAIDERLRISPSEESMIRVRERYQLPSRFLMYSGNVKPHKNLERLIEAFKLIHDDGDKELGLLITGSEVSKYATLRRAIHRYRLHKHVRFLGYQSTETLSALYRLADVFVFPSLYEGFGLPPLEALACGTPVVASNVSSLPEVLGDAALLVDPYSPQSIRHGIRKLLDNKSLRDELRDKGLKRAQSFSWEQSTRRVLRIYNEVISND